MAGVYWSDAVKLQVLEHDCIASVLPFTAARSWFKWLMPSLSADVSLSGCIAGGRAPVGSFTVSTHVVNI